MYNEQENIAIRDINTVTMCGEVSDDVTQFNTASGVAMTTFTLIVPRLSRVNDYIPVIIPSDSLNLELYPESQVKIRGAFRSRNEIGEDGRRHLRLQVSTKDIVFSEPGQLINEIVIAGTLCKDAILRRTPKGRTIADLLVACQRKTGKTQNRPRRDFIPTIAWGNLADHYAEAKAGSPISFKGRIQSRDYTKTLEDGSKETRRAYEVSILELI